MIAGSRLYCYGGRHHYDAADVHLLLTTHGANSGNTGVGDAIHHPRNTAAAAATHDVDLNA